MNIKALMDKIGKVQFPERRWTAPPLRDYQKLSAAALVLEDTLVCPGHEGHYCRHCEATIDCFTAGGEVKS